MLRRKTPLRSRQGLRTKTRLRRATGLARVNHERRERLYARQFGEKAAWIRTLPCCACSAEPPSDPHHVRSRGAGGTSEDLVPLCRECHDLLHLKGRKGFALIRGCDLAAIAERLEAEWQSL